MSCTLIELKNEKDKYWKDAMLSKDLILTKNGAYAPFFI